MPDPTSTDVTVVIRTYNSEQTLGRCLSILRDQTIDVRILIVDSGSTDRTVEMAQAEHADIIYYPKDQPFDYSKSLNQGWQAAETEWVFFCSSHVWLSHRNAIQALQEKVISSGSVAGYLSRSGDLSALLADQPDSDPGPVAFETYGVDDFIRLQGIGFFSNQASLIPRAYLEKRAFEEGMPCSEDLEWAKYWCEKKGGTVVRMHTPHAVYANPYETEKKKSRERVYTYQTFFPKTPWLRKSKGCLGKSIYYLRRNDWGNAFYTFREAWMYPLCKVRPFTFSAKYH